VVTGYEGLVKAILAWTHGLGWFAMCALVIAALKLRLVDIRLAVAVAVLGGIGPSSARPSSCDRIAFELNSDPTTRLTRCQ
jgi:hypothetical protein